MPLIHSAASAPRLRRVQKMVLQPVPKIRRVHGFRNLTLKATGAKHADLVDLDPADRAFATEVADDFVMIAAADGTEEDWDACDESFLSYSPADDDDASVADADASFGSLLDLYRQSASQTSLAAQAQISGLRQTLTRKLGKALARLATDDEDKLSRLPSSPSCRSNLPASLSCLIDEVLAEINPIPEYPLTSFPSAVSLSCLLDDLITEISPAAAAPAPFLPAPSFPSCNNFPASLSAMLDDAIDTALDFSFDLTRAPSPDVGSDTDTVRPTSPQLFEAPAAVPLTITDRVFLQHRALGRGLPESVRLRLNVVQ